MKLILFAHTDLGINSIKRLIQTENEILLVFTHPTDFDKNEKVWYGSVKDECIKNNIKILERVKLTLDDINMVKNLDPDIIFAINWRRIIPTPVLKIPKYCSLNIHAGSLPRYAGFAPINWAIINGEKEIGITVHEMEEKADAGGVVIQKKIDVGINDTAKDVFDKVLKLYPEMIIKSLEFISKGKKPFKQNKSENFFVTKRFPKDGRINWSQNRIKIHNLIRALVDPFPNAFCYFNGEKIFIKKAELLKDDIRGMPGRICAISEKGFIVTCGTNYEMNQGLLVTEIATEKETLKPKEFFKLWDDLV